MEKAIRTWSVPAILLLCLGILNACKKESTVPEETITKELLTARVPDDGLLPYIQFDGTVSSDPLTITGDYRGVPDNANGAWPFVMKKQ